MITWLYNRLDSEEKKKNFFLGLVFCLFGGLLVSLLCVLLFGLAAGLVVGILLGITFGLTFGLGASLVFGLATGLFTGLVFGLATGLFPFSIPLLIAIIAIEEILFWLDREKLPLNRNKVSFTVQKKFEALFETGLAMGAYPYLYELPREASQTSQFLLQAALYSFYGAVAVALTITIVLLGSMKYGNKARTTF